MVYILFILLKIILNVSIVPLVPQDPKVGVPYLREKIVLLIKIKHYANIK